MPIRVSEEPLRNKEQTGARMYAIVERFAGDLDDIHLPHGRRPLSELPLRRFFDVVRGIPYKRDTKPIEVIARPRVVFARALSHGADCKKKATLLGAWAKKNGVPFRFVATSRRPDGKYHHVFPQMLLNGRWQNTDATYSHYRLFEGKPDTTAAEIL